MVPPEQPCPARVDDGSISDDERLCRRLIPGWIVWDGPGAPRCSSAAFVDRHTGEVSVFRASMTTPDAVLRDHPEDSVGEIETRVPRGLGYKVVPDPDPGDPGAAHAVICPKASKSHAKTMAQQTRLTVVRQRVVPQEK